MDSVGVIMAKRINVVAGNTRCIKGAVEAVNAGEYVGDIDDIGWCNRNCLYARYYTGLVESIKI